MWTNSYSYYIWWWYFNE